MGQDSARTPRECWSYLRRSWTEKKYAQALLMMKSRSAQEYQAHLRELQNAEDGERYVDIQFGLVDAKLPEPPKYWKRADMIF